MNKKPQIKRMNQSFRLTILALAVLVSTTVTAQDKRNMFNPVNTSVTSQTIAPDARSAGMGDVGAATDPDVKLTLPTLQVIIVLVTTVQCLLQCVISH